MPSRIATLSVVLSVAAVLAISGLVYRRQNPPTAPSLVAHGFETPIPSPASRPADWIGDARCAECHPDVAERYHRTPMGRSFARAAASDDLLLPATVTDANSGLRFTVFRKEGEIVQAESPAEPADAAPIRSESAAWRVGSGEHASAFLWEYDGAVSVLPLAWYGAKGKWGLNPGYELRNRRFDRTVAAGCLACHASFAQREPPAPNRFEFPFESGIGCERCHGPGLSHATKHAEIAHSNGHQRGSSQPADPSIIHPAKLAADRANDVCFQCHLSGDVVLYREGRHEFSFRPGDRLADHRLDFLLKSENDESFGVGSHATRMMASRCYTASDGKLRCVDCHDAHAPHDAETGRTLADRSAAACRQCHSPDACHRPDRSNPADEQRCTACHMPQRPTREAQHLVFTDHRIRRTPPQTFPPPFILPPNATATLGSVWPDVDAGWLAAAQIEAHHSMGPQAPMLKQGVSGLLRANQQENLKPPLRRKLIEGLVSMNSPDEALRWIDQDLARTPDDVELRYFRGVCLDQQMYYEAAITEYERVIEKSPHWQTPWPLLIRLQLFRQRPHEVLQLLDRQEKHLRLDAVAWTQRGLAMRLRGDEPETALAAFDRALQLDPRDTLAWLARADTLIQVGRSDDAIKAYQRVLELVPGHPQAVAGLQRLGAAGSDPP